MISARNIACQLTRGLLAAVFACGSAAAQDVASFYKGKQVTIVVGSSAGGGYDTYARLISRFMSKHIPGNPTLVVSNMPGAGSNIAADHIYFKAPKDGTQIGALEGGAVVEPLFGTIAIKHDPSKFQYLGSANNDVYICVARTDAPVKSFADVLTHELITGGAPSSGTSDFPVVLNNVLGTKFKMVLGYTGSREISLAMEKHEVEAVCGVAWPSYSVTNPGWFENGVVKVIVQAHVTGHPDLNKIGIPLAGDFARTPEQRAILELYFTQTIFGRPYVVAPEVPADRVAALRQAFTDTLRDPELIAEAKKLHFDVDQVSGDELERIVGKVYASPADLIAKTKQATVAKQ